MPGRPQREATAPPPILRRPLGLLLAALAAAVALVAAPAASAAPPGPAGPSAGTAEVAPDILAVRWQNNREVQFGIKFPGPTGEPFPAPGDRRFDTYLIGNVNPATPQDPGGVRPGPAGTIWIPPHDDALDPRIGGFDRRALTDGFWVVPGDDAPPGAVLTRDTAPPPNLPPGTSLQFGEITELVYAIKLGPLEVPLTSTARVRLALLLGWVETRDVGFGGTVWVVDRTPPFASPPPPPSPPA